MVTAINDSAKMQQRMVGAGFCMEKFEDSPIVYESFAESAWAGTVPNDMPGWVSSYVQRRYGGDEAAMASAQQAWEIIFKTFYSGTGEHGSSIRTWPPTESTSTVAGYEVNAAPRALSLLLQAHSSVWKSGQADLEYDIVMVGFEFLQTLFEDYWSLAKFACNSSGSSMQSCATAIHRTCPGLVGNDCIECAEAHAQVLASNCSDLDSQMHGICGAIRPTASSYSGHDGSENVGNSSMAACNATSAATLQLILDLDVFVGSHPMYLLGRWLNDSHVGAADAADARNLEYGARNLVTLWGGDVGSDLAGYDGKIWEGLLRDVYAPLWGVLLRAMHDAKATGKPLDPSALVHEQFLLVQRWVHASSTYKAVPVGHVISTARDLMSNYTLSAEQLSERFLKVADTDVQGFSASSGKLSFTDLGVLSMLCWKHPDCRGFTSAGEIKTNVASPARHAAPGTDLYIAKGRVLPSTSRDQVFV
mmetsp:Transcript_25799/g.44967  ORF Transcript_25799/g.44967 Transcript_25799/m.44967 type:complete len:476 (+) Transcript_25799:2-1429(+)